MLLLQMYAAAKYSDIIVQLGVLVTITTPLLSTPNKWL
jgi:hypothetical protein